MDDLTWVTSTLASDANEGEGVMLPYVRSLQPGLGVVGTVSTLAVSEGDNLHFKDAVALGSAAGSILVIGGSPTSPRAVMGGILAVAAIRAGFTTVVTDGLIRDSIEVLGSGVAVWCRGLTPLAGSKNGPGGVGHAVDCAGVRVAPGDLLVADDDGVVVWPAARVAELLEKARRRERVDAERLERVRAGGSL